MPFIAFHRHHWESHRNVSSRRKCDGRLSIRRQFNFRSAAQLQKIAEITITEGERVPDLSYRLTLRRYKMKAMTQLWRLQFSLHEATYQKFTVATFLKWLPALELVCVDVKALDAEQIDRFIENQGKLKNWAVKVNKMTVSFERK